MRQQSAERGCQGLCSLVHSSRSVLVSFGKLRQRCSDCVATALRPQRSREFLFHFIVQGVKRFVRYAFRHSCDVARTVRCDFHHRNRSINHGIHLAVQHFRPGAGRGARNAHYRAGQAIGHVVRQFIRSAATGYNAQQRLCRRIQRLHPFPELPLENPAWPRVPAHQFLKLLG